MMRRLGGRGPSGGAGLWLAAPLVLFLGVPLVVLALSSSAEQLRAGIADPLFWPALSLSFWTSLVSLGITIVWGLPLAWWLAKSASRWVHFVDVIVELPIVLPPSVIGVALLLTLGRQGVLGPALAAAGLGVPFTSAAVVVAQVAVSAPFFVQAAASAFRRVDSELLLVARTLGATRATAFFRVALPLALPGLVSGASLAWARALGEFGATLLFAGNMVGATQTLPLAIFSALETDARVAVVFALVLGAFGAALLVVLRLVPALLGHRRVTSMPLERVR